MSSIPARWVEVIEEGQRRLTQSEGQKAALRFVAEYARTDHDFVDWWLELAKGFDEPIRHRSVSFILRLKNVSCFDFNREYRASFD